MYHLRRSSLNIDEALRVVSAGFTPDKAELSVNGTFVLSRSASGTYAAPALVPSCSRTQPYSNSVRTFETRDVLPSH